MKEAEASEEAPTKEEELTGHPSLNTGNGLLDSEDLEDGEVKDDQVDNDPTSIAGVKDEPIQIDVWNPVQCASLLR